MFKPVFTILGATVLVVGVLAAWQPVSGYARATARQVHQAAEDAMPLSLAIERLQTLVDDLDTVVGEQRHRLIEQEVALEGLAKAVERSRERVAHHEAEVRAARSLLAEQHDSYRIAGREHDRATVVAEAQGQAAALTRAREVLEARSEAQAALERAVQEAQVRIAEAQGQREQYDLRLAQLRAQAESVAIRSELTRSLDHLPDRIDDGAFRGVEEQFARIERRLTVEERALERGEERPAGGISFTQPQTVDVLAELDAALAEESAPAQR